MMPRGYALLVEPDLRLLHLLLTLVKAHKLEPVPMRDGALARDALKERGAPTILITNLSLPRVDGFALLAELREIAGPSVTAAVVISSSMEMRARAYDLREQLGIAEIISSTLSADSMQSTVRRALEGLGLGLRPTLHAIPRGELGSEPSIEPRYEPRHEPRIEQKADSTPRHQDPQRLARIANLGLVDDGPPAESLQRLVAETARTFGVPIALISLVLQDRQWFKAHFGLGGELLEARGTPISQAFCRHIVDADTIGPLIVPDATRHPVFADNPLVLSGAVGSYAGAPLLTAQGDVLGTLCIIDSKPLGIDQEQVEILVALARRVAGEIELQTKAHAAAALSAELGRKLENEQSRTRSISATVASYGAVLSNLEIGVLLMDEERQILYANPALAEMMDLQQADLISLSGQDLRDHIASLSDDPEALQRQMHTLSSGPFLARAELVLARPKRRTVRWDSKPVELSQGRAQLEVYTEIHGRPETSGPRSHRWRLD